jgi:GT2 family glycosyltransferase
VSSKGRQVLLCRLGERVLMAPAGDVAAEKLAARAVRHLDMAAGAMGFRIYQMPPDFEMGSKSVGAFPSDLTSFLDQFQLPSPVRAAVLRDLFGTIVRMLRLQSDPILIAHARSLAQSGRLPEAVLHLDLVEGCDTVLATIPARGGFREGDVLLSLASEALAIGRIEAVRNILGRESRKQKLAAIFFAARPEKGECLLVGANGLVRVTANMRISADLAAFHTENAAGNPDLVALLAHTDEEAATVLNLRARRVMANPVIDEPLLGFKFGLDVAVPLAHGLFVSGWFYDPEARLESVIAIDHGLFDPVVSDNWKVFDGRVDIQGDIRPAKRFAAFLKREEKQRALPNVALRVVLDNGESHMVTAIQVPRDLLSHREAILGCAAGHAFAKDMLTEVYGPALAPIQAALNARQAIRHVKEFGTRSDRKVSIVIPLYKEIGFIRSQLTAFATDPFVRTHCEIVYVLDDPLIALQVNGVIEGSALIYPLDLKLVTLDRNGGYALANNMGVSQAEGETLILMNSDVIPDRKGWIEQAVAHLGTLPPFSVIGPKLLYADESLQHAGMYFFQLATGYWQNFHFWKGYGRHYEPATRERIVPAVTGACMILRKAEYEAVGGFTTDYVVGDYEDSDLCLKLREKGGLPCYMPSIELFHFERQSMPNETDGRDRGSTIYNRALHSAKWDKRIQDANASILDLAHAK